MVEERESEMIVVGVDGSPGSVAALRWAVAEAGLRRASVEVVSAWSIPAIVATPFVPALGYSWADLKEAAQEAVDQVIRELGPHPDVTVTTKVIEGRAAHVLLDEAADADLLVVGSRGLGGAAELLLGSTSHTCAHHTRIPLVVVPRDHQH
jgi:nucleotide-binding universal stress UspA family protein